MSNTTTRQQILDHLTAMKMDMIQNMRFDRQGSRYDYARKIDALDTVIAIFSLVQVEDMSLFENYLTQQAAALRNSKLKNQNSK